VPESNWFGHFELQSSEFARPELTHRARSVTDEGYP
jgi:hypothetical protein